MRIAQLILPGASQYERKSQRLDAAQLAAAGHDVLLVDDPTGFDLAHIYGPLTLPRRRLTVPYLASGTMRRGWGQPPLPPPRLLGAPIEGPGLTPPPRPGGRRVFPATHAQPPRPRPLPPPPP